MRANNADAEHACSPRTRSPVFPDGPHTPFERTHAHHSLPIQSQTHPLRPDTLARIVPAHRRTHIFATRPHSRTSTQAPALHNVRPISSVVSTAAIRTPASALCPLGYARAALMRTHSHPQPRSHALTAHPRARARFGLSPRNPPLPDINCQNDVAMRTVFRS